MMIEERLGQEDRLNYMRCLNRVVRDTGLEILKLKGEVIHDTTQERSHQYSTVDSEAGRRFRMAMANHMDGLPINVIEESEISSVECEQRSFTYPLALVDYVEGSENAKRGLSAHLQRPIHAGVSVMILESELLASVVASAFFDFASKRVYSSVRAEPGSFLAFVDEQIISAEDVIETRGDTRFYATVPGYAHSNVQDRADTERVLQAEGIQTYGGSRSSAQDLLDILCNQSDSYVDLRARFRGTTDRRDEVLHSWDVGSLLPMLDGLGFLVADPFNRSWQDFRFYEPLALVVARPSIGQRVRDAIRKLSFVDKTSSGSCETLPIKRTS